MIQRELVYDKNHFTIYRVPAGIGKWEYIVMYKDAYVCATDDRSKAELIAATFLLGPSEVIVKPFGYIEVSK